MTTITEDYVSFEIAKLLKEKGFYSEDCFAFYKKNGEIGFLQTFGDIADYDSETCVIAPTHQMAMKWLRKTHKLFIEIHIEQGEKVSYKFMIWDFYIIHPNKYVGGIYDLREEQKGFSTPEQAIETALKYSLENLI